MDFYLKYTFDTIYVISLRILYHNGIRIVAALNCIWNLEFLWEERGKNRKNFAIKIHSREVENVTFFFVSSIDKFNGGINEGRIDVSV